MSKLKCCHLPDSLQIVLKAGLIFLLLFESYILLNKGTFSLLGLTSLPGGWQAWQITAMIGTSTFMLFKGIHHHYHSFAQIPTKWFPLLVISNGMAGLLTAAFALNAGFYALTRSVTLFTGALAFLLLLFGMLFLVLRIAIIFRCLQTLSNRYQLLI